MSTHVTKRKRGENEAAEIIEQFRTESIRYRQERDLVRIIVDSPFFSGFPAGLFALCGNVYQQSNAEAHDAH